MIMKLSQHTIAIAFSSLVLAACDSPTYVKMPSIPLWGAADDHTIGGLDASKKILNEKFAKEPGQMRLSAVGFSSVSIQPSKNINQRRLMAMRAAKIDAYRSLTEQIHGIQIQGETTIGEAVLTSDSLASAVQGLILGAETVKIEPTSTDTYQVELVIHEVHLSRLIKAYRKRLL